MDSIFDALIAKSLAGGSGGGGGGTDNYNALQNKPQINGTTLTGNKSLSDLGIAAASDIPTVNNGTLTIQKNGATIDTFKANQASDVTVNITVPTTASDVSALPSSTKYAASLSLTINSSTYVVTGQLKDQDGNNLGSAQTIDLPLETMVVGGSYDAEHKKIVLTLKNGNTVDIPVADLVSGLQTELSATNKLDPAFINYDSTHAVVTDADKTTWSGKQDALTFDGTYSASTNKAATVSTVTNAINALDVTGASGISASKTISAWSETDGKVSVSTQDISISASQAGLGNVTNDAQVKKISSSTTGNIVTWNAATGDTVADSGVSIETNTNFSASSDTKIPTSKSIATNVAANAVLTGYSVDVARSNITTSSTIRDAVEQLEYREETNKNNILLIEQQNGAKNLATINNGTHTGRYKEIPCAMQQGKDYLIIIGTLTSTDTSSSTCQIIVKFSDGTTSAGKQINRGNNVSITWSNVSKNVVSIYLYPASLGETSEGQTVTWSDLMVVDKAIYDAGFTDYQPYALPNTTITPALQESVDNGAKNYASINAVTSVANYVDIPINIKAGTYVLSVSSLSSTSTNTNCRIGFYKVPTSVLLDWIDVGTNKSVTINIPSECDTLRIFAGNTTSISSGYSVTFTNLMLCKESEWNVSRKYVSYAMSNVELTQQTVKFAVADMSDGMLDNLAVGTITSGNASASIAGMGAGWCSVETIPLNASTGTSERKYQKILMITGTDGGKTKVRLFSGTWGNWVLI